MHLKLTVSKLFHLLVLIISASILFSCNKPTTIGAGLLPDDDNINTLQANLILETTTVVEDSLRTDKLRTYPLGTMKESVFGATYSDIFTQVLLPSGSDFNFEYTAGDVLKFDSAVLTLYYSGFYGDTTGLQTINIYRMNESMDASNQYYSNKSFAYNASVLGKANNFIPNTKDSIDVMGKMYPPHLRIKLTDEFGDSLLHQSGTTNLHDNTNFFNYLKGLYISTDTNSAGKGMMYINLVNSVLTLYYKSGSKDSLSFDFKISSGGTAMSQFRHNYFTNNPEVSTHLNKNNDSIIYIQSMAGLKTKIKIPGLKDLGKILVNKAELVLTQINNDTTYFNSPEQMLCVQSDSTDKNAFTEDQIYQIVKSTYYGGKKSYDSNEIKYKFNLAFHIQKIADNPTEDYGLYLLTFPSSEIADRVILGGGNHSQHQLKLNLTYTKIN